MDNLGDKCGRRCSNTTRNEGTSNVRREVIHGDALEYLMKEESLGCIVTSLPDISELRHESESGSDSEFGISEYKNWLECVTKCIVSKLKKGAVAIFYQTDVRLLGHAAKHQGYIDKSFFCTSGALSAGGNMVFHKIALRNPCGSIRVSSPTFTHVLCYEGPHGVDLSLEKSKLPDVMERGAMDWSKAIGVDITFCIMQFMKDIVLAREILDPFCGTGTSLCVANIMGLDAVGIERSLKRCKKARRMQIDVNNKPILSDSHLLLDKDESL